MPTPTPAVVLPPAGRTIAGLPSKIWGLAVVDGAGTGVHQALTTVLVARRFGLAAAGFIGVAAVGRLAGMAAIRRCEQAEMGETGLRRTFSWLIWIMTLASMATIAAAAWGPIWSVIGLGLVWSAANSGSSTLAVSLIPSQVVRFGPWSMAGSALGAFAVGGALGLPLPAVVLLCCSIELLQLFEPWLVRRFRFPTIHGVALRAVFTSMGRGLLAAGLCYGPVVLYAALTVTVAGRAWIGPAMLAYAAGALCAGRLDELIFRVRRWPTILIFGAAGVGTWVLAVNGPGLLIGRFVSGACLFTMQGRLLRSSLGLDGSAVRTTTLGAVATGLGLGAGLGSPLAGWLVAGVGVRGMAISLAAATLAVAAIVAIVCDRRAAFHPKAG